MLQLGTLSDKEMDIRSHLINGSRWRGQRFWLATRRDAGRIPPALTEEQQRGRAKDRPLLVWKTQLDLLFILVLSLKFEISDPIRSGDGFQPKRRCGYL